LIERELARIAQIARDVAAKTNETRLFLDRKLSPMLDRRESDAAPGADDLATQLAQLQRDLADARERLAILERSRIPDERL
jgi:hypothetical protein